MIFLRALNTTILLQITQIISVDKSFEEVLGYLSKSCTLHVFGSLQPVNHVIPVVLDLFDLSRYSYESFKMLFQYREDVA